jgi:hypothetical protein
MGFLQMPKNRAKSMPVYHTSLQTMSLQSKNPGILTCSIAILMPGSTCARQDMTIFVICGQGLIESSSNLLRAGFRG